MTNVDKEQVFNEILNRWAGKVKENHADLASGKISDMKNLFNFHPEESRALVLIDLEYSSRDQVKP